jgi:hypothetical protein
MSIQVPLQQMRKQAALDRNTGTLSFFYALLQNLPCLKPMAFRAAIRFHAEEDMPLRGIDAHF